MSSNAPGARGRYIIQADDATQLAALIAELGSDPGAEVVDTIGPAGQPHTLVVDLPHEKAASLEQRFRNSTIRFNIEPDRPLSLFGAQQDLQN